MYFLAIFHSLWDEFQCRLWRWSKKLIIVGNPLDVHVATPRSIPPCDTWHASFIRVPPGGTRHSQILYPNGALFYQDTLSGSLAVKKQAMLSHLKQLVTAHISSPAERKDRNDSKSPPMISDSRLQGDSDSAITSGISWQVKKSSHY